MRCNSVSVGISWYGICIIVALGRRAPDWRAADELPNLAGAHTTMNDERSLWRKLLRIEEPWSVLESRIDSGRRRHDVWIGLEVPRGWFGLGRKPPPTAAAVSWRHVRFGDWDIRVHVAAPDGADLAAHPWAGDPDLPFTRALNEQVFALLREGCSLQSICTLLDLPIAELWRFRYAVDSGRWSGAAGGRHDGEVAAPAGPPEADSGIPDVRDPVWLALLDGSRQIDVRVLGLKLLLTRLRAQLEMISDDDVRMLKLHEFHRYFIKNRRLLAHELAQIRTQ
jgi:hypothetical protein